MYPSDLFLIRIKIKNIHSKCFNLRKIFLDLIKITNHPMNHPAVIILICAISNLALGALWYHPKVLGTIWLQTLGKPADYQPNQKKMVLMMVGTFLLAALMAAFIYAMIFFAHMDSDHRHWFGHGAFHGTFIFLGTILPALTMNAIFEEKNWKNTLIHLVYWLISMAIMGGIVDVLR